MCTGVQPVNDRQGLCQDSRLWSRKVVWFATQAYDAQGNFAFKGFPIPCFDWYPDIERACNEVLNSGFGLDQDHKAKLVLKKS